ncbi:MAG TPA: ABC transporter ATP-binding protein [Syntrophales bacterium]|nr:ABC transporter ATP-binding protein [Syntrophales bacterium]
MNFIEPILEVKNLKVRRGGVSVLDISDIQVPEGRVLCLIGPNGAGKSTLLLALSRLLKSINGEINFRGEKIDSNNTTAAYRRHIAMVFQEPLLFDTTVFENVASGLKIRGIRHDEIRRTVEKYLVRFGISHLADRSARKLSGGEAQRTSLARAFAIQPEIIFLDEPFSSLDPPTRESLMEDLERILRETKTTTVMATHDQMEALRLSDQIAVMNEGKIVQIGSPAEVMNNPVDEFVASFVGMETVLAGRVTKTYDGTFITSVSGRDVEAVGNVNVGEEVVCFIRPENVTLSKGASGDMTSARNVFPGMIVKITPMGLFHKIHIDCGFPLIAYVTSQSLENLSLRAGNEIIASFKATAVHVVRKEKLLLRKWYKMIL